MVAPLNMDLPPPLDHVFVDYENVQALDISVIGGKGVTFTLLLGSQERKLDVELVGQLFAHAASVELVRLAASGNNALDFTLAYYIGRAGRRTQRDSSTSSPTTRAATR